MLSDSEIQSMKFDELNKFLPKGVEGDIHSQIGLLCEGDGWSVKTLHRGKYGPNDYVVQVKSEGEWDKYKSFTHGDFFEDVAAKAAADNEFVRAEWLPHALRVIQGEAKPTPGPEAPELPGIDIDALTVGTQALAVCEFRRYPRGDSKGGGRYLPINFTSAILHGHWTADEAWDSMRQGLPALRRLDGFRPFRHIDDVDIYIATIDNLAQV